MIIKRLEEIVRINPNKIVYKYDDKYITLIRKNVV